MREASGGSGVKAADESRHQRGGSMGEILRRRSHKKWVGRGRLYEENLEVKMATMI